MAAIRWAVVLAAVLAAATAEQVTPIQKVLQMMEEMKTKAKEEKQGEIDTFNQFTNFCRDTIRAKGYAIKDGAAKIGKLSADIEDYDAKAEVLGREIKTLDQGLDETEHEKAEGQEVRDKAKADYQVTHSEYVASLDDMEVGLAKLKKMQASSGAAAASSFIQKMATTPRVPASARKVLESFLAKSSEIKALQPEQKGFESQSDGVVDMMADLKDKMAEEKTTLETEEMNAEHSHQMIVQALDNQIKKDSEQRTEKASTKKQMEQSSAVAKGDLADATNTKAEDEKYTADLTTICQEKSADFEARQKLRAEELVAIDKAMEIIGDQSVSGSGAKHLPQLLQKKRTALAQLRNNVQRPAQSATATFLHAQGRMLNSRILSALAVRVSADPFVKVRKMIGDMLEKLEQEANDEADHKGFCDQEMSTNEQTREEKTTKVAELKANIEEETAASAKLANEIADLNKEISEMDAAVAEATRIRQAEKTKNTATIADAKVAIAAVEQATKVLKDFYAKAASATALVQRRATGPADDVPATFDEPFTGTGGEGGVVGMLEVILSDFQRLEQETTETETSAAAEYKEFSTDSAEDRETKRKSAYHKGNAKSKVEHNIHLAKKDLAVTQKELDAAMEYFEKLKPSCVDVGVSYEDRVAQRENEIQSLKEALKILEGEE